MKNNNKKSKPNKVNKSHLKVKIKAHKTSKKMKWRRNSNKPKKNNESKKSNSPHVL